MRRRTFLAAACASAVPLAAQRRLGAIAFVQPDGLTVRSLPDGPFIRLATGGHIRRPRFSPSGQWLTFHDGALYVASPEGDAPILLPNGESVWMPGQDVLAVASGGDLLFFSARNGWRVPALIRKGAGLPVFDASGTQFVFSSELRHGTGPGGEPIRDGQLRRGFYGPRTDTEILTQKRQVYPVPFGWTPDAQSVLYWEDLDFSESIMADGLGLFRVAVSGGAPEPLHVSTLVDRDLLAFSPRGNRLALTAGGGRETWDNKRIGVLDLDTRALRYLTPESMSALAPAWSPDGGQIAFTAAPASKDKANLDRRRIWIADARGERRPLRLTADSSREEKPLWSAFGTHILFCRVNSSGTATLWMKSDEGDAAQVSGDLLSGEEGATGYYGYVNWGEAFDWFRGPGIPPPNA